MVESEHGQWRPKQSVVVPRGKQVLDGLPTAEQLSQDIAEALLAELATVEGLDPDVARRLDREMVLGWITEDVTAALADVADNKLTETST